MASVNPSASTISAQVTLYSAIVSIGIGSLALIGIWINEPLLASFDSGLPGVKANAAVGIIVSGLTLWLLGLFNHSAVARTLGSIGAYFIILLGASTVAEYLFSVNLYIDELIFKDANPIGTEFPGRMAIMTAINFILKGWSLLIINRPPKHRGLSQSQFLSVITLFLPLVALLGYIYGIRDVRGAGPFLLLGVMAVPMGVAWIALSIGTLFARPSFGFMRFLTESSSASFALRCLLLPAILVPVLLTLMLVYDIQNYFYIPAFGAAVFTTIAIAFFACFIWYTVSGISTLEVMEKKSRKAQERSELSIKAMFDLVPTGMAFVNTQTGQFIKVNQKLCNLTGYSEEELLNKTFRDISHPDDDYQQWPIYQQLVSSDLGQFRFEKRYIRKNGDVVWVDVMGFAIGRGDKIGQNVAIIQDLTLKKAEEETLQRAKEAAEAANQMKTSFLANMSHELRTPLGVISGFAELAEQSDLSHSDRQGYIASIRRNTLILKQMIDEILDLAKVESGKLTIEKVWLPLNGFFCDFMTDFLPLAQKNKNTLLLTVNGPVPSKIFSDPTRLRQVLVNIVGNAIKFTQEGEVTVDVSFSPNGDHSDNGTLNIFVSDTGPGIPKDQTSKLFQPFSQVDSSMTRKYGGTGLGLVLAKKLAQALGGDIILIEREMEKGSKFVIRIATGSLKGVNLIEKFDFKPLESSPPNQELDKSLTGVSILLAEDSVEIQLLIKTIVNSHGAKIKIVANGKAAVKEASFQVYDVILMDLQMPELDGYEATKQLRERGYSKPIIALSAAAMREDYERALDAGCNAHLTKPFNYKDLIKNILYYAQSGQHEAPLN